MRIYFEMISFILIISFNAENSFIKERCLENGDTLNVKGVVKQVFRIDTSEYKFFTSLAEFSNDYLIEELNSSRIIWIKHIVNNRGQAEKVKVGDTISIQAIVDVYPEMYDTISNLNENVKRFNISNNGKCRFYLKTKSHL